MLSDIDLQTLLCGDIGFAGGCLQVFEGYLQWAAMGGFTDSHFTRLALEFIRKLAGNLRDNNKVSYKPRISPGHICNEA